MKYFFLHQGSILCFEEMRKCYYTIDLEHWDNGLHDDFI